MCNLSTTVPFRQTNRGQQRGEDDLADCLYVPYRRLLTVISLPCLFLVFQSLTCLNQSSSSRRVADSDADQSSTCQAKIHYHCAREAFLRRGREDCPTCGQRWDKYLMKKEGENGVDGEDEQPGAISSYRPEAASSPPVAAAAAATSSSRRSRQSNR